jgi:hypothetical protein
MVYTVFGALVHGLTPRILVHDPGSTTWPNLAIEALWSILHKYERDQLPPLLYVQLDKARLTSHMTPPPCNGAQGSDWSTTQQSVSRRVMTCCELGARNSVMTHSAKVEPKRSQQQEFGMIWKERQHSEIWDITASQKIS